MHRRSTFGDRWRRAAGPVSEAEREAYYGSEEYRRAMRDTRAAAPVGAMQGRDISRPRERRDSSSRQAGGDSSGDDGSGPPSSGEPSDSDEPPDVGLAAARQERVAYFGMLADGEHPLELRRRVSDGTWHKDFVGNPRAADEVAHRRVLAGHDVYVGMAPRVSRHGDDQRRYAPTRVLWVDLDTARSVRKLDFFEPTPTAVVLSGGIDGDTRKRYAIWVLAEPLAAEEVKRHLLRVAHHLEADMASTDPARILRVPGSRSHKTGRVATLVSFTGEAHDLAGLTGDLPDAPSWAPPGKRPGKTTSELVALFVGRHPEGERHEAFRSVVGVLLRRGDRLPPDVLLELAVAWAQTHLVPCRDRAELERNFDNLLARERARRGWT